MYAIGTALVHFCMLCTTFAVKNPNVELAEKYEVEYLELNPTVELDKRTATLCSTYASDSLKLMQMA